MFEWISSFQRLGYWQIAVPISLVLFGFPSPDLNIGQLESYILMINDIIYIQQEYISVFNFF